MTPWISKLSALAAIIAMIALRGIYGSRNNAVKVVDSRKTARETALLLIASLALLVQLVWSVLPWPVAGDRSFTVIPYAAGWVLFALGMLVIRRAHEDLGSNWSNTLELRETHRLIVHGVYRRIAHPLYAGMLLWALGVALLIDNWLIGPSYLVAFALLVALRLGPEESMMRDQFGREYDEYLARTKRIIPGVF